MNERGQLSTQTIFGMAFLIIMLYIFMEIYTPVVDNFLIPAIANETYGSVMTLIIQILPLILFMLALAYPIINSKWNQGGQQ